MTSTQNQDSCSICLEPLTKDSNITKTACGHTFHANCLLKASQRTSACPLCRAPLFEHESNEEVNQDTLTNFLLEFIQTFPNPEIMNEIHEVYYNTFLAHDCIISRDLSYHTRLQLIEQLQNRIGGYFLFAYDYMRNNESTDNNGTIDADLNYLT